MVKTLDDPNGDGDTSDSIRDNTVVIFTSDNGGTHFDNNPLRGVKGMFTEGGIRVPLIASWPGVIPTDAVTDRMVHGIDLYPTCLELAGKQWTPSSDVHPLDGESFAKVLRNLDMEGKRAPIFYLFPGYMDIRAQPCVVAIDEVGGKRYKLLYFYEALVLVFSSSLLGILIGVIVGSTMMLQFNLFLNKKADPFFPWTQSALVLLLSIICAFLSTWGPAT